jgi:hypothetical protein
MRLEACKAIVGYLQDVLHADVTAHAYANAKPRLPELAAVEKAVAAAGTAGRQPCPRRWRPPSPLTCDAKLGPGVLDRITGANDAVLTPLHEAFDRDEETWERARPGRGLGQGCRHPDRPLPRRPAGAQGALRAGADRHGPARMPPGRDRRPMTAWPRLRPRAESAWPRSPSTACARRPSWKATSTRPASRGPAMRRTPSSPRRSRPTLRSARSCAPPRRWCSPTP